MSLWSEILEQPSALERLLRVGRGLADDLSGLLRRDDVRYVVLAARGTSDNAGRYAQYLWGSRVRLPVALATPSLFTAYARPPDLRDALVVALSQSGRSPDLVAVVEEGRRQGRPTLVITNDPASPLGTAADHVIPLEVGPELAVAATKTYTAQLVAVAMLAAGADPEMRTALERVPGAVAAVLEGAGSIRGRADARASAQVAAVLGRGYNLATAFEWALKLQELCALPAIPFSSADFRHGPTALAREAFPLFAVAPAGPTHDDVVGLLRSLRAERGCDVLVLSDRALEADLEGSWIALPDDLPEWLSPVTAIVAAQVLTHALTVARGLDPDAPEGLQKVTRTW